MTYLKTVGGPGVQGLHPQEIIVQAKNGNPSSDLVVGDIVYFDFVSGTGLPGNEVSAFYTVKTVPNDTGAKTHHQGGIFGVCQSFIARNGGVGPVMISGITNVKSAQAAKADQLVAPPGTTNTAALSVTPGTASRHKIIAHVLSISPSAGEPAGTLGSNSDTFPLTWFDGLYGFGVNA
jgi:hypothetical protein